MSELESTYFKLLELHGLQGWWPIRDKKTAKMGTYHPGEYAFPRNAKECFEICLGAILTQNSSWSNVEQALFGLDNNDLIDPVQILECDEELLKSAIRPAGYYNQKAKKIILFTTFFQKLKMRTPSRCELLSLWGIGPETADSILLYAYGVSNFVVDTYTRRIFESLGVIQKNEGYEEIRSMFEANLPCSFEIYQEYHALIVAHAKKYFSKKSGGANDPLLR